MKDIRKLMFLFDADRGGAGGGSDTDTDRGSDRDSDRDTTTIDRSDRDHDHNHSTREDRSTTTTSESTSESKMGSDESSEENNESFEPIKLDTTTQVDTSDEEKKTARQTVEDVMKGAKDLSNKQWAQTEAEKERWGADLSLTETKARKEALVKELEDTRSQMLETDDREQYEELAEKANQSVNDFRDITDEVGKLVDNIREVSPDEIKGVTEKYDALMKGFQTDLTNIDEKLKADPENKQLLQAKESIIKNYGEAAIQTANAIEKLENQLGVNPTRETATWGELYDYYMQEGKQSGFWTAVGAFAKSAWETIKQGINPFDKQSQFDRAYKQAKALRAQAETVVRVADVAQKAGHTALNLDSMLRTKVPFNTEDGLNIAYMTNADPSLIEMIKAGVAANVNRAWMKNYFTTSYKGNLAKIPAQEKWLAAYFEEDKAEGLAQIAGWDGALSPEAMNMPEVRNYLQKASAARQAEKEMDRVSKQAMDELIAAMNKGASMGRNANFAKGLSEMGVGLATMMLDVPTGLLIAAKGLMSIGDAATADSLYRAKIEFDYQRERTLASLGAYGAPNNAPENEEVVSSIIPEEEELDFNTINNLRRRSNEAQNAGKNRGLSDSDVYSFIKQNYAKDGALQRMKV